MCEQGETIYNAGEVVWVKMGTVWWPAEVMDQEKLSPDVIPAFKKPPIAIVKFFQEDMYEYIRKDSAVFKYQCAKKNSFIKKGLDMYRAKQVHMEKFPEDVIRAERATGGDTEILTREEFQEVKKERYSGSFANATKTPSSKKGQGGKSKMMDVAKFDTFSKMKKANVEYKSKILVQGSQSSPFASTSQVDTCTLTGDSITTEEPVKPVPVTPTTAPGLYSCHSCAFTTSRLNTMIMHNKSHSVTAPSYIPTPVPKNHKTITPTKPQKKKIVNITKTPKIRKPKKVKVIDTPKRKRAAEEQLSETTEKKSKTNEEIKSSLLADWDDEWAEEEQTSLTDTPETPDILVESQLPLDHVMPETEPSNNIEILKDAQNGESSDDKPAKDSRYEFCEEEDWPLETDVGRKIPRVKNLPKQKTDSRVIDDETVAREVSDLLDKTTLPELPSVPEPLKVEANFPEPSVVKSPDKTIFLSNECSKSPNKIAQEETQGKTIFKTKTFFRSRHSRSQDAIEKYIAEQLNATEKIDSLDSDINGSDATSSPEGRGSPTVEPVKIVRLAPKIQLKKLKAESQLKEMSLIKLKNDDNKVLTSLNAITDLSSDGFCTDTSKHQLPSTNISENELAHSQQQMLDNVQVPANLNINDRRSAPKIDQELSDIQEIVLANIQTSVDLNMVESDCISDNGAKLSDIQEHILNVQTSAKLRATEGSSVTKSDKIPSDNQENILDNVEIDSKLAIKRREGLPEVQEKKLYNVEAEAGLHTINRGHITFSGEEIMDDQYNVKTEEHLSIDRGYSINTGEEMDDKKQIVQGTADFNVVDGIGDKQLNVKEQILSKVQTSANFNTVDSGSISNTVDLAKTSKELQYIQELILGNVQTSIKFTTADNSSVTDNVQVAADLNVFDGGSIINAEHELSGDQAQILDNIQVAADLNAIDEGSIINADNELSDDQEQILDNVKVDAHLNDIDGGSIINADNELSGDQEQILDNVKVAVDLNVIDGDSIINADNKLSGDQDQILDNVKVAADLNVIDGGSIINADNELSGDQEQILDNVKVAADLNVIDGGSIINADSELSGDQEQILDNVKLAADLNVIDGGSIINADNELSGDQEQILDNVKLAADLNVIDGGSIINADNELSGYQEQILHNVQVDADLNVDADSTITAENELSGEQKQILDNVQVAADLNVVDADSTVTADNEISGDQEQIVDNVQPAVDWNMVGENQSNVKEQILNTVHTSVNLDTIDSGSITSTVDFMLRYHGKKDDPANLNTVDNTNKDKLLDIQKSFPKDDKNNLDCHVTESQLAPIDSNEDTLYTKKCYILTNDKKVSMAKHTLPSVNKKDSMSLKVNNGDDVPTDINNIKDDYFINEMLQECNKQLNPNPSHVTSTPTVHELLCAALDSDRVSKSVTNDLPEDLFEEDVKGNLNDIVAVNGENPTHGEYSEISHEGECVIEEVVTSEDITDSLIEIDTISNNDVTVLQSQNNLLPLQENVPSESDLQVAEALITLPSTHTELKNSETLPSDSYLRNNVFRHEDKHTQLIRKEEPVHIQNNRVPNDTIHKERQVTKSLFETEKEKNENLNAAQLLVEMSETVDHKVVKMDDHDNVGSFMTVVNHTATSPADSYVIVRSDSLENKSAAKSEKKKIVCTKSASKLLQVLEKPLVSKTPLNKTPSKTIRVTSNEKIINFEVNKLLGGTPTSSSQKIVVRKPANKNIVGPSKETLVLSRSKTQEGSSVQTYTIQTTPEPVSEMNVIIQERLKNISKLPPKIQKIKPVSTILGKAQDLKIINNCKSDSTLFDINSMPVVLSDDIVTPENIEKLPIVMSDGKIIKHPARTHKVTSIIKHVEKVPTIKSALIKSEVKSNRVFQVTSTESNVKSAIPNILSKSSNIRNTKQMFIHDKTTGKQTMVVPEPTSKNITSSTNTSSGQHQVKGEKYIVLQKGSAPKPVRQQKIVIDPKSGKAHVILPKTHEAESTPVSAKLVSSVTNTGTSGTVMIITNAQGSQSRIVLTSEHEKILFPNNQHLNLAQLKTVVPQRPVGRVSQTIISPVVSKPPKLVPKEKTIITSKGQLIVGGRLTTTQTIAPKPEIRPARRFITVDPSKSAPQRSSSEPLIFLQQKSGSIMQLTQSQFENLQKSGQLFKKPTVQPVIKDNKIVVQKSITLNPSESIVPVVQKQRARTARPSTAESPLPKKRPRLEPVVATVPARAQYDPTPAFDNFEELLPSTAIARQNDSAPLLIPAPEPIPEPAPLFAPVSPLTHVSSPAATAINEPAEPVPAALNDGNLLAVPGEHFGGPAGSFYLCIEDCGTLTPLDNRPLMLENNQLVPMGGEAVSAVATQPERRDILEAALANSDVFRPDATRDEAPDFRDLNANVSVHCRVSETSSTLHQPIMSPQELPSTAAPPPPPTAPSLEAGLAVIGVTPHTVPTSLELPITVTDPRIAPRAPDPLSFGAPISMPLLTDEDDAVGKSMPILTDDLTASHA